MAVVKPTTNLNQLTRIEREVLDLLRQERHATTPYELRQLLTISYVKLFKEGRSQFRFLDIPLPKHKQIVKDIEECFKANENKTFKDSAMALGTVLSKNKINVPAFLTIENALKSLEQLGLAGRRELKEGKAKTVWFSVD